MLKGRKMKNTKLFTGVITGILLLLGVSWIMFRPIKIGVILSSETTLGYEENLVVKYFQSRYPRIAQRPVKFLIENPETIDEKLFTEAYERLESQGAAVILSGEISKAGMLVAPLAEKSGITTFGITTSTHLLSGKNDNFFRTVTPTDFLGSQMAQYINSKGVSKVAVITSVENSSYADSLAQSFEKEYDGDIRRHPFVDYDGVSELLRQYKPDALYCILKETSLIQVIKAAEEWGEKPEMFSSDWGFMQLVSMFSGPQLDGITAITRQADIPLEYVDLINDFEAAYNIKTTFASYYAFSILFMLYDAVEKVGPRAKRINEYFNTPRVYDELQGLFYMDEYGDPQLQYHYFSQIQNNELVLRERFENPNFTRAVND